MKLNLETQREIFFKNFKTNETKLLKFDYANRYFSNFIALVDGPILTCMDLNENNWSFDFTEHSEYIDVFNGKLKDGEVQAIFSILEKIIVVISLRWKITAFEVQTGEILWEHSFDDKLPLYYVEFQNVFHVFNDRYYEINGETGAIINERNLLKELQEESIRIYWLTHPDINNDFIAFLSPLDKLVVVISRKDFSIQKLKLDKSKSETPLAHQPKFFHDKLLQLDGDNNLYVFEM